MSPAREAILKEYGARRDARRAAVEALDLDDRRIAFSRLAVVIAAVPVGLSAWSGALSWGWLALPAAAFAALVVAHDRILREKTRAARALRFYEDGLARIEERWKGDATRDELGIDEHHPYASDLDLFGRGSLFELLDVTRSLGGSRTLASWLLEGAAPRTIRERQSAIEELRPRLDLRESLAALGEEIRADIDPETMRRWGNEPASTFPRGARVVAPALAAVTSGSLLAWAVGWVGPTPFLAAAILQGLFAWSLRARVMRIIAGADRPERHLELLATLLRRVERESFRSPLLERTHGVLRGEAVSPSAAIRRLARLTDLLEARRNQLFITVGWLTLWTTQCTMAVEAWRRTYGGKIGAWLDALATLEALDALAGYAAEHPDDPFPEIADEGAILEGEDLGHPLIPASRCVRNTIRLGEPLRLLLISGSNMSGKSTLLRTVGVNAVLAMAGAPVRASRMRVSPFTIGATMRVHDSLQEGSSRFWAEINRIKAIVAATEGTRPVLALLDELFGGTNSHDRSAGAAALLRGLVSRGALALVTTHDLALASLADELAPAAVNVHFEDHLEDGRMSFDYRLRPGVVARSNALALMRAVGLDV